MKNAPLEARVHCSIISNAAFFLSVWYVIYKLATIIICVFLTWLSLCLCCEENFGSNPMFMNFKCFFVGVYLSCEHQQPTITLFLLHHKIAFWLVPLFGIFVCLSPQYVYYFWQAKILSNMCLYILYNMYNMYIVIN